MSSVKRISYITHEKEVLELESIVIENELSFYFSTQIASWSRYSLDSEENAFDMVARFKETHEEEAFRRYDMRHSYRRIRNAFFITALIFTWLLFASLEPDSIYFQFEAALTLAICIIPFIPYRMAMKYKVLHSIFHILNPLLIIMIILCRRTDLGGKAPSTSLIIMVMYFVGIERRSFVRCLVDIFVTLLLLVGSNMIYMDPLRAFVIAGLQFVHCIALVYQFRFIMVSIKTSFAKQMALLYERQRTKEEHDRIRHIANCIVPASMVTELCDLVAKERVDMDYTTRYHSSIEEYQSGTFLFATIYSKGLSAQGNDPTSIVCAISSFVHLVDTLCEKYRVDRIKTIGTSVLIVSGVPDRDVRHTDQILSFALELRGAVSQLSRRHALMEESTVTIGVHRGPCIAGIIGLKYFTFDVWGDSINITSRLNSTCEKGRIHVSSEVIAAEQEAYYYEGRGPVYLKGKGMVDTFYLLEKYATGENTTTNTAAGTAAGERRRVINNDDNLDAILDRASEEASKVRLRQLRFEDKSMESKYMEGLYQSTKGVRSFIYGVIFTSAAWTGADFYVLDKGWVGDFLVARFCIQIGIPMICWCLTCLRWDSRMGVRILYVVSSFGPCIGLSWKLYLFWGEIQQHPELGDDTDFANDSGFYFAEICCVMCLVFILPSMTFRTKSVVLGITSLFLLFVSLTMGGLYVKWILPSNISLVIVGFYTMYMIEWQHRVVFMLSERLAVEAKTIDKQKQCTQRMILSILPKKIYDRLQEKPQTFGERHTKVCVLYADIVSFTQMVSEMNIDELNELLNHLFVSFDRLCFKYRLQKLKSLGDCVVVVGNVNHDLEVAEEAPTLHEQLRAMMYLGEEAHEASKRISVDVRRTVRLRIGIALGDCISGVIGSRKFSYDMWGEAMIEANAMESTGIAGRTQVSPRVYNLAQPYTNFEEISSSEGKVQHFVESFKVVDPEFLKTQSPVVQNISVKREPKAIGARLHLGGSSREHK